MEVTVSNMADNRMENRNSREPTLPRLRRSRKVQKAQKKRGGETQMNADLLGWGVAMCGDSHRPRPVAAGRQRSTGVEDEYEDD
jgi:hypothetical protein